MPINSTRSNPSRRYVNSTIPILYFSVLCLISVTSSEVCDNLCVSSKALADGPKISSGAHLQDNFIQRPARWAKDHLAHAGIVCALMAGTRETSPRAVEFHGTPRVRASAAVRPVFAVAETQQHSGIVSCWVVEVEAGSR